MKPMLASPAPKDIRFPVLASPKIDGVRAIVDAEGNLVSRSLKPIRNEYVRSMIEHVRNAGLDGELVVGDPTDPNCMQNTTSGVMRATGEPDFVYHVFDQWNIEGGYVQRSANAAALVCGLGVSHIRFLYSVMLYDQNDLDAYEARCLGDGYEGVMLRDPNSPYKFGRSSAREGYLLKVKRFEDAEAVVIGVEELMHNENEAKRNALGRTERSTAKAGLVGAGTLGKLIVRREDGVEFGIGTGFTAAQRQAIWNAACNESYATGFPIGRIVTYKHFANGGVKDAPRFPVFKAFRDASDLS